MQITHLRVAMVVAHLQGGDGYARARSPDAAYLYRLSGAQRHGAFHPFDTADARELDVWLRSVQAGRKLCHEAWDLFMDDSVCRQARSG